MIIYFFKLKINLEDKILFEKLKKRVKKDTFYIPVGFLKGKMVGEIKENNKYFWVRWRGYTLNSFTPTFYGNIEFDSSNKYIKGYFYINPVFVLFYCVFIILTYASILGGISKHSIGMTIGMLLILLFGIYGNMKDIKIIKEFLQDIAESNIIIDQTKKNMIVIISELMIIFLVIFLIIHI